MSLPHHGLFIAVVNGCQNSMQLYWNIYIF